MDAAGFHENGETKIMHIFMKFGGDWEKKERLIKQISALHIINVKTAV